MGQAPRLSNLVNYVLDVELSGFARKRKGVYTRYADDLTFSFPRDYSRRMRGVVQKARAALRRQGYLMHAGRKLRILRPHQRQQVTGLVVNAAPREPQRPRLPRETRRWLRAVEHRAQTGGVTTLTAAQLRGWRALRAMVERRR